MPVKVLVFDKNPQRRKVIEAALDSDACLLAFARDGREGVAKFEAFKPDFLIANEELDDITGMKVFRDLKKTGKITDSQFILMIKEDEENLSVPEKIFFLKKPFKTADIINLLEEVKMVKDNQSDFDLVEAEMDKVVQNLRKDNDEIMQDISSSPSAPSVVKLSTDKIVTDSLEPSEELEIIDDLLEANDEELENMIDENENYSSKKLGVEPAKEKSKEEELDDLEKELYGNSGEDLQDLAESEELDVSFGEEVPEEMLMDLEEATDDSAIVGGLDEEYVEETEIPEEETRDEEPVAGSSEEAADETEASAIFDDLVQSEDITEDMLLNGLNDDISAEDAEFEIEAEEAQSSLEAEEITEDALINEDIYSESMEEEADESSEESALDTDIDSMETLDEGEISDEEFRSAAEIGHTEKSEERSTDLDLDSDEVDNLIEETEIPLEEFHVSDTQLDAREAVDILDSSLTFGEELTEEDLKQAEFHEDLDESLFETKAEEIKAEEALQNTIDGLMKTMITQIVHREIEKSLREALPEFSSSLEGYVRKVAPDIIKQVVIEEIEKLKEG